MYEYGTKTEANNLLAKLTPEQRAELQAKFHAYWKDAQHRLSQIVQQEVERAIFGFNKSTSIFVGFDPASLTHTSVIITKGRSTGRSERVPLILALREDMAPPYVPTYPPSFEAVVPARFRRKELPCK